MRAEDACRPMQVWLELEKASAEAKEVVALSDLEAPVVSVRAVVVDHLALGFLVLERHDREHPSPGRLRRAHVLPRLSLCHVGLIMCRVKISQPNRSRHATKHS